MFTTLVIRLLYLILVRYQIIDKLIQGMCSYLQGPPLGEHSRYLYNFYIVDRYDNWYTRVINILIYILYIPITLVSSCLIFLKGSQDIIQGISKLDYLLKVSVFQHYKDKEM